MGATQQYKVTRKQLEQIFNQLSNFGRTVPMDKENYSMSRLAYTKADEQAHCYLIDELKKMGYLIRQDAIGNVFARLLGRDHSLPAIAVGSHIDTVPSGGRYDGVAGILAGMYAMGQLNEGELKHSIELVIFRAEESSRFGFACMGSKVLTGAADLVKWKKNIDKDGISFFNALDQNGYNSNAINECHLSKNDYRAFFEAHIEQGCILENNNQRIGIVDGIAAPSRYRIDVHGNADHSGATPMAQRHDALVASAMIIGDIHTNANHESIYGTVGTVGKLDVSPNSINVIPGDVQFYVDIRGVDEVSIDRMVKKLFASIEKTKVDHDVQIDIVELSHDHPVHLDYKMGDLLEQICQKEGIKYRRMISGAGHDAMYMAQLFPTSMLFIPSKKGVSHNPEESSDFSDIILAGDILKQVFELIDCQ